MQDGICFTMTSGKPNTSKVPPLDPPSTLARGHGKKEKRSSSKRDGGTAMVHRSKHKGGKAGSSAKKKSREKEPSGKSLLL